MSTTDKRKSRTKKQPRRKQPRTLWKEAAKSLPKEKRQEFLDYVWQGLSIGEAEEKANITFAQSMGIIALNLKTHRHTTLNKESV